jgi:hypothetical protein
VLRALDGSRDQAALIRRLSDLIASGDLIIHHQGQRIAGDDQAQRLLETQVPQTLELLLRQALLVE